MEQTPKQILLTHLHRMKTLSIDEEMIQQDILELHIKIGNRKQLFTMMKNPNERDVLEHNYDIALLECQIELLHCKERRASERLKMESNAFNALRSNDSQ